MEITAQKWDRICELMNEVAEAIDGLRGECPESLFGAIERRFNHLEFVMQMVGDRATGMVA